jgi:hypothetical protein
VFGTVAGGLEEYRRGLVAWILERSGRDAKGTGGGVPFGLECGVLFVLSALFLLIDANPDFWSFSHAVLEGGGGGSFLDDEGGAGDFPREGKGGGGRELAESLVETLLVDSRREGSGGRDWETLLVLFVAVVFGLGGGLISCLLGGRAGSSASPHAGARIP